MINIIEPKNLVTLYENSNYLNPNIDVDLLSTSELKDLYSDHWLASPGAFSKLYTIGRFNFLRWLKGRFKECPECPDIIRDYLKRIQDLESYEFYRSINLSIVTLESLLNRISFLSNDDLRIIIFVDADNVHQSFRYFDDIIGDIKFVHIIALTHNRTYPSILLTLKNKPYYSLLQSDTTISGAVDIKLSTTVSIVSAMISYPMIIILCSNVHFVNELADNMSEIHNHIYIKANDFNLPSVLNNQIELIILLYYI